MSSSSGADTNPAATNPRRRADEVLASVGVTGSARVLEPSPPPVTVEPFFADDPVAVDDQPASDIVVLPSGVLGPGTTWDEVVAAHPDLRAWAARRWLTAERRFAAPPPDLDVLAAGRTALHRLAAYVIAPVRHRANGRFGLRWVRHGFGTPFFSHRGRDRQIRVAADDHRVLLVDQVGDAVRAAPVTTLADAAAFLDAEIDGETAAEHDSPPVGDPDAPLAVDPATARFLGSWFAMAVAGLEGLRSLPRTVDPSRPQLWPGHFDPAIDAGSEATRASYGASPGDDAHPEPYLYVSVWWPDRVALAEDFDDRAPGVRSNRFTGRLFPLSQFPDGADPAAVATRFWAETSALLEPAG